MKLVLGSYPKSFAQVAMVLMIGAALSACSSVPGWVDPTTWVGGDDSSDASQLPADQSSDADQGTDQTIDQTADADQNADTDQTDLASIPDRPAASSTEEDRQQVADSLSADRSKAQYSGENLRGDGTGSSAPPPAPAAQTADAAQAPANKAVAQDNSDQDEVVLDKPSATPGRQVASTASARPVKTTASTGPAVPANSGGSFGAQANSDAALGFQPSKAPPLDASVSQFVAQPIVSRYQQTASIASAPGVAAPAVPVAGGGTGGPEAMSGAVVANLDALQGPAGQPGAYAGPTGMPPAAVIFFPHDTTVLNGTAKQQVRAAIEAYKARGGQGFIKVVGHSSSRTANMTLQRHLVFNFERSQARATAVAKELIREGVPADKVLVEAVGDSQPVYYESMPQGEEGNRRAEIFIQG